MNDLIFYSFIVFVVALIIFFLVRSQSHNKPSTIEDESSRPAYPPADYEKRPTDPKTSRFLSIWRRLNPKVYLEDDATEPLPPTKEHS